MPVEGPQLIHHAEQCKDAWSLRGVLPVRMYMRLVRRVEEC